MRSRIATRSGVACAFERRHTATRRHRVRRASSLDVRRVVMSRACLYDAYAHAETPDDGDGDGAAHAETRDAGVRFGFQRSRAGIDSTHALRASTRDAKDATSDVHVVISDARGNCVVYAGRDDFEIARGRASARDGDERDGDKEACLTAWSADERMFACARSDGRLYACTRVGKIVCQTRRNSGQVAGCALALARTDSGSEPSTSYDLLSVNLKGAPVLTRTRVMLERVGGEVPTEDSISLAKELRSAVGAEWVERERALVVLGRGRSSAGSVIVTWTYDNADDFVNLRCVRAFDCGGDVVPKRSFFCAPERARMAVRLERDGSLNVAATTSSGFLSVFIVSKEGKENIRSIGARQDVVAAAWWSRNALAVATREGNLTVRTVPGDENVLGDEPESFDSIVDLVSEPKVIDGVERGRLLLLERPNKGGWRLISINERTALEMLHSRMDAEEWGVALTLARQHGLDTDEIYKTRWVRSRVTTEGLTDWLARIGDRAWVAVHCLTAYAETYEIQRHVLVYGLKESDAQAKKFKRGSAYEQDEGGPRWSWWIRVRIALLAALDRADTVHEITGGGFSPKLYKDLLYSTIRQAALDVAYANDVRSLEVILRRHVCGTGSVIFEALSALPETTPVSSYEKLLPWSEDCVHRDARVHVQGRRARDWAESAEYLLHLTSTVDVCCAEAQDASVSSDVADTFQRLATIEWMKRATEEICKLEKDDALEVPSAHLMETWAIRRACEMNKLTGSLGSAHQLLASASAGLRTSTLRDYAIAASALASASYVIFAMDDGRVCDVSLEEFFASDMFGRVETIMAMVSAENVSQLLSGPVRELLTYARNSSQDGAENVREMLQRWILHATETGKLKLVSRVVKWLSSIENVELVGGAETLAAVVVEASLSRAFVDENLVSESADVLSELPTIISEVPVTKRAVSRLNACKTMQENDVCVKLSDLINAERDEASALNLLRQFIDRVVAKSSTIQWSTLWSNVHKLQSGVFQRSLTHETALGELLRAQLRQKDWSHAKRHVPGAGTAGAVGALVGGLKELGGGVSAVLPPQTAELVICNVADEFLARAEDASDEYANAAENCLLLAPSGVDVRQKLEFLQALRFLLELDVRCAPRAISAGNALDFVLEGIHKSSAAYRTPDLLQELLAKLGVREEKASLAVLLATGSKAFESGDIEAAYATAMRLSKRNYGPAWNLCAEVARSMPPRDVNNVAKGALIAFSLAYADQDALGSLLSEWQLTQTHQMLEAFTDMNGDVYEGVDHDERLLRACGNHSNTMNARPAIKLLAQRSQFGGTLNLIFKSTDEKAKEAASAITYALGTHGSNVSDDVLAKIAASSIEAALKSSDTAFFGTETPPATMWSSMAVLLTMRDSSKVSAVIEEVASNTQDRVMFQTVLHVGTCVHALRALRPTWDSVCLKAPITVSALIELVGKIQNPTENIKEEIDFVKQFRSNLGSVVDAEWLSEMIPEIDAASFSADGADYRKRAIMALAAGSSSTVSTNEALANALRLAEAYGVDAFDVYSAHAAVLASEDVRDVRGACSILKEKLPTKSDESIELLQASIWGTLPTRGQSALESALAYFEVLSACDLAASQKLRQTSIALQELFGVYSDFDLHAFVDGAGDVPKDGKVAVLAEIQRAKLGHLGEFPASTVMAIIAALEKFPNATDELTSEDVFFAVARNILSPPPGATRMSPDQRWSLVRPELKRFGVAHLVEIANALGGVESPSTLKELSVFSGETSSRTRLTALEDILGVIGAEDHPELCIVGENLRLVLRITDEVPGLHPSLLRILEESLCAGHDLQDVAVQWAKNSATFGQISTLAALVKTEHSRQSVDVLMAVSIALRDALVHADKDPSKMLQIIRTTLGAGSPKDEQLAITRSDAYAALEAFVGVATPEARVNILKILSELAGGTSAIWQGWQVDRADGDGVMSVLAMRTGVLLAPYGFESPEESSVRDVEAMLTYFSRLLADVDVPFSVLAEILTLWEEPPKRTKTALKPCWMALLKRGLRGGDVTMDIVSGQIFSSPRSARWLSEDDLAELLAHARSSGDVDDLVAAKLSFILGKPYERASSLDWDAEAVAFAVHGEQVPDICSSSEAFEALVTAAFEHERGRDLLLPHVVAALTRARMYECAALLAVRLTTVHPLFAADFDVRLEVLRRQLQIRAQRRETTAGTTGEASSAFERCLAKLTATLSIASASASGALDIALS